MVLLGTAWSFRRKVLIILEVFALWLGCWVSSSLITGHTTCCEDAKKGSGMTICCFRFLAHVFLCISIILHLYTRPAVLFFSLVHFQLLYLIILWLIYVFYYTLIDVLSFVIFRIFCSISCGTNSNTLWVKNMFVWAVISTFCELFFFFFFFVTELFHSCLNLVVMQFCHSYIILVINDVTLTTTKFEGVLCVTLYGPFSVLQCSLITFFHFSILIIIST